MYKIVERDIGRAGNKYKMEEQKREWDKKYGAGKWKTGYEFEGRFITREEAIELIYDPAYFEFLDMHPDYVQQLKKAKGVFNPHAVFSNSVDIQAAAVIRYMNARGYRFDRIIGAKTIPIGTFQPKEITPTRKAIIGDSIAMIVNGKIVYPQISIDLSPYNIKCLHDPSLSVEDFWQSKAKCLGILL